MYWIERDRQNDVEAYSLVGSYFISASFFFVCDVATQKSPVELEIFCCCVLPEIICYLLMRTQSAATITDDDDEFWADCVTSLCRGAILPVFFVLHNLFTVHIVRP